MPRIQILQLPDCFNDERPPFVLVIDQAPRDEALSLSFQEDLEQANNLAEHTGARAVVCFEDTIEIPANDTSAYATGSIGEVPLEVPLDFPKFGPPASGEPLTDPDRIPGRPCQAASTISARTAAVHSVYSCSYRSRPSP